MATRVFAGYRLFKDSGAVCTDGTITFYLAGTSTLQAVYSDKELTSSLGSSVSCGSLGIPSDIWVADDISIKAVIAGTGVTTDTIDYLTVADATISAETTSTLPLGNAVVNGAFSSWTAGSSFSNISGSGTGVVVADAWYFTQPSAASNAVSRQTASSAQTRYALRFGRPNSSSSTNELRVWQMLPTDEAYRLRGQEVTLSFTAKAGALFSGTGLAVRLATGTAEAESGDLIDAGTFTGHSSAIDQTQAITTTATRYEFTATLGASIKEIGIQFSYTGVGTAGATDHVDIEDVQVEIAADATSFKFNPEPLDFLRASMTAGGRLVLATPFTDPGADRMLGWDDSAGTVIGYTPAAGITTSTTNVQLDLTYAAAWTAVQSITVATAGTVWTLTSTEAGATSGPDLVFHRDSASPLANDVITSLFFRGEDSASNATDYASIVATITDPTDASEDGSLAFKTMVAGVDTTTMTLAFGQARFLDGSAASPSVKVGDEENGLYSSSANALNLATGGVNRVALSSAGLALQSIPLITNSGTVSTPQIVVRAVDTTTGIYSIGTGNWGFASGGALAFQFDSTGAKDASGNPYLAGGKRALPIVAGAMTSPASNGAAIGSYEPGNGMAIPVRDFDAGTEEYACFVVPMPKSWNESTMTARFRWTGTGTGNVIWGIAGVAVSDDDTLNASLGTAQEVTDAQGTAGDQMTSAETSAITIAGTPAEGDLVCFRVYRKAANGADTLTNDARLIAVDLFPSFAQANDA